MTSYKVKRALLAVGSGFVQLPLKVTPDGSTRPDYPTDSAVLIDGRKFILHSANKPWSLAQPYPGVWDFEIREGEQWYADARSHTDSRERNLLATSGAIDLQTEYWWAFTSRINNPQANPTKRNLIFQCHQRPDTAQGELSGKTPPLSMVLTADQFGPRLTIDARGDASETTLSASTPGNTIVDATPYDHSYTPDVDYDYVFNVKFDWTGGSILRVWQNGSVMLDLTGLVLGYNDVSSISAPSWQFGMYRSSTPETTKHRVGNIVTPQTQSLAARVAAPLTLPA